ncbi:MAG: type II secretion system F family protein [Clostridia bacterium]
MDRKGFLKSEELSVLCEQVALILRAGLPLHDGVEALSENYHGTRYAPCFAAMDKAVAETGSLYQGLQAAGVFPSYIMEMTNIGEKTGNLEGVMQELSEYYDRETQNRRAIQNAVLYPLLLISMMAVLIAVLILRVMPIFENVFMSLGLNVSASPWMGISIGVGKGVLIGAGVLIVLTLALLALLKLDRTHRSKRVVFRIFSPLGRLNRKVCATRFAATLAMLMSSGYPLEESLELIETLYSDEEIRAKVCACRKEMAAGMAFPEAMEKIGLFEPLHCRMVSVGFRAGQADRVMVKLAKLYEQETDDQISHLVSIIEPSLVALMSIVVGAILLAVMLPLLSIMGGIA